MKSIPVGGKLLGMATILVGAAGCAMVGVRIMQLVAVGVGYGRGKGKSIDSGLDGSVRQNRESNE